MHAARMKRVRLVAAGMAVLLVLTTGLRAEESAEATAANILEAAGVTGGLVVHVGCGDGRVTAELHAHPGLLVHGLDRDEQAVAAARAHVRNRGRYGPVSIEVLRGERLPYTENLVNLLILEEAGAAPEAEIDRVLAPEGVLLVRQGNGWQRRIQPRPDELGRWTHYLHGPDNNAVTPDTVAGPPDHLQWIGDPLWARSHEHLSSVSAMVTCGRRVYSIVDEGPIALVALDPDWQLVARDAFSGVVVWKRPVGAWEGHLRGFRSGPPELTRRLVASTDRLFVTLGYGEPLSALDPATGETLTRYEATAEALEVLYDDGTLYVVTGSYEQDHQADVARRRGAIPPPRDRRLVVLDAESGEVRWERSGSATAEMLPVTLTVAGGRVLFQNPRAIVCLDAATGESRWETARPISVQRPAWSTPTLVAYEDVVLSADREASPTAEQAETDQIDWTISSRGGQAPEGELIAFCAESGERLWSTACREVYNAPVDVLVVDGLVWSGYLVQAREPGITVGRDVRTGEVVRRRPPDQEFFRVGMSHHRCYRNKATSRFLVLGRSGIETVDVESGEATADHWVRGACQYGVIPANGLIYVPTHPCACFIEAKLNGFNALAPRREAPAGGAEDPAARLEKGPAYEQPIAAGEDSVGDWPTFRSDAGRSGAARSPVPAELRSDWSTELGGRLSSLVVAGGRLWVAQVDEHTVHALDAEDGRPLWSYTAGGRIDSPPTIWEGRVLFGSADGWITCLRSDDGSLIWRFRAAPEERRIVVREQLESAWPVHGSVLVQDGVAYAVAGRSAFVDDGMRLVRLDPATGRLLSETRLDLRDPETGRMRQQTVRGFDMPGLLPDVLSSDGESIFMRHARFNREGEPIDQRVPHLFSPAGFLDDSWWHRTYWMFGTKMHSGWGGWPRAGSEVPSGRLLVHDGETIFGFGRTLYARHGSHVGLPQTFLDEIWPLNERRHTHYRLFAESLDVSRDVENGAESRREARPDAPETNGWKREFPLMVRAMVLAGDHLFLAGPPDVFASDDPLAAWEGRLGATLLAVRAGDGADRTEYRLPAPPVFDGLVAAGGNLYLATADGRVSRWTEDATQASP